MGSPGTEADASDTTGADGTQRASAGDTVADLHVHTTVSDGQLTLEEVPAVARDAGLSWVGITDHDRLHPGLSAPIERRDGVRLVRGIELRVEAAPGGERSEPLRVDLLGYGVEPTAELTAELERIQRDRLDRGREIVRRVETQLGVELDVTIEEGIGRPHVARAIAESDTRYGYQDAFDQFIGDDGPCFVPRNVPSFERGVELLSSAARLVALAHPLRYGSSGREALEAALALSAELDAIETAYPYATTVDPDGSGAAAVEAVRRRHGLLATGGSDAHGSELGVAGLDASAFEPVRERLADL